MKTTSVVPLFSFSSAILLACYSCRFGGVFCLSSSSPPSYAAADPPLDTGGSTWIERREDVRRIFREEIYGIVPDNVDVRTSCEIRERDPTALGGTATRYELRVKVVTIDDDDGAAAAGGGGGGFFEFPLRLFVPNGDVDDDEEEETGERQRRRQYPVFLLICNRSEDEVFRKDDEGFTGYWPVPEIVGSGFATAAFWAGDVDPDDGADDFANGIHPLLDRGSRTDRSWGAIAAWAWGASRALDALTEASEQQLTGGVDPWKVAVIGHSRGGKTALWAAAEDERFAMAVSNNSGCTGAALSKRKASGDFGETVRQINEGFPNWFCERYRFYNDNEAELPVDQHMLLALLAPRGLSVSSATMDDWADPVGEYLSLRAAASAWEKSHRGVVDVDVVVVESPFPDDPPSPDVEVDAGPMLHYHLRTGEHDLTVGDWKRHIAAAKRALGMTTTTSKTTTAK